MRLVALVFGLLTLPLPVMAQELDGNAVLELALRGMWDAKDWSYWSWHEDNTVCVRLFASDEDCADTGTWAMEGPALCYELTWFGEGYGVRENCFTVRALDENSFETWHHGGALETKFFAFSVIE